MKYILAAGLIIGTASNTPILNGGWPPKCPDGYAPVLVVVHANLLEARCAKEVVEPLK
jgi:hypothetical protein